MRHIDDLTDEEFQEAAIQSVKDLGKYLTAHKDDIALGIDDYGLLRSVYFFAVGEDATPTEIH